jgi:hypothetical protein
MVKTVIAGVLQNKSGWNITGPGDDAGWLNGSAFSTWAGKSVITRHVWDADNQPGLFAGLKYLKFSDTVIIRAVLVKVTPSEKAPGRVLCCWMDDVSA